MSDFRVALTMFTVFPAGRVRLDRPTAVRALRWLPVTGVLIGGSAGLCAIAVWHGSDHGSPLLAAVVAVGVAALGSRGLHLDGLADLADGLGSRRPAAEALEIMRRSDIGPFGVAAIVFAILLQIASLTTILAASSRPLGLVDLVAAVVTGRLAVVWAAARGVPPAHTAGFGALVADSAGLVTRTVSTGAVLVVGLACTMLAGGGVFEVIRLGAAMLGALVVAGALRLHAVARFGGVTGDVFGALVEITTTACLFLLAATTAWP